MVHTDAVEKYMMRQDSNLRVGTGLCAGGCYIYVVALSTTAYWFFVSLIPVYNKHFFQKEYFPYPIATAGIQLGVVGLLLVVLNASQHLIRASLGFSTESWVFGPHIWWKLKAVFPIGFLFGLKYGVTNLGLHLVPAPIHLLLQSTDLIWTIIGAWWINGESVSKVGLLCVSGCIAGSIVLSIQVDETVKAPMLAIAVNLLSPVLLGLCIATLRSACVELMRKDNRVQGSVSSVELTALKLIISSSVAIILACVFDNQKEGLHHHVTWWAKFGSLSTSTKLGVLGGSLPILAFQVNCTFLTGLTSAVSVGLVGQLKIIPQWIMALLFAPNVNFHLEPWNIAGALLSIMSAGAFAINNWMEYSRNKRERSLSNASLPDGTDSTVPEDLDGLLTNESVRLLEGPVSTYATQSIGYHAIDII